MWKKLLPSLNKLTLIYPQNKKVRHPKSPHRKTQTPIVATQTKLELRHQTITIFSGICDFTKFI